MTASIQLTVQEKEEDFMGATFERTFTVAVPVGKAWAAFVEPEERQAWMGVRPAELETGETKIGRSERHRLLSWSDSPAGLEGWYETTVTFEELSSRTRITIVRSGFGDSEDWRHFAESTNGGWDEMIADLVLYLEAGVHGARHFSFRSGLGANDTAVGRRPAGHLRRARRLRGRRWHAARRSSLVAERCAGVRRQGGRILRARARPR